MAMPTSSPDSQPREKTAGTFSNLCPSPSAKLPSNKRVGSPDSSASPGKRQHRSRDFRQAASSIAENAETQRCDDPSHRWCGKPINQAQAHAKWHRQYGNRSTAKTSQQWHVYNGDKIIAHYKGVDIEDVGLVSLGDFVELDSGENDSDGHDKPYIMEVLELFEDVKGGKYVTGQWFYSLWNTALVVHKKTGDSEITKEDPVLLSPKHIFRASDHDNAMYEQQDEPYGNTQLLQTINKRVEVRHVCPGNSEPEQCDYWWSQEHDRRFMTFIDKYPEGSQPEFLPHLAAPYRELKALHLYCGAGGMSFVGEQHSCKQFPTPIHTAGQEQQAAACELVHINTCWAVDNAEAMCRSFQVNHRDAKVWTMGVDEMLMLSKKFKELSDAYPEDWVPSDDEEAEDGSAVNHDRQQENAALARSMRCNDRAQKNKRDKHAKQARVKTGKAVGLAPDAFEQHKDVHTDVEEEWEVEKITNVRIADNAKRQDKGAGKGNLLEPLTEENCWMEFELKWEGWSDKEHPDGKTWEAECDLNCKQLLFEFIQDVRRSQMVPLPGEVDVVMGGPPCQGVTGHNRHALRVDILDDSRNRQMTAFYEVVNWFKPGFVLMENVVDILRKEDGIYAKSAMGCLLQMGYQVRMGIIAACDQGVPQARNRVFMWGAKSGVEQLPPFPEPSHNVVHRSHNVPDYAKACVVDFQTAEAEANALPLPKLGDMLSDLPEITSFSMAEGADYKTEPQTPYQHFLRRDPPEYELPSEVRAAAAAKWMEASHDAQRRLLTQIGRAHNGAEKVGALFACQKQGPKGSARPDQLWQRMLKNFEEQYSRAEAEARQAEAAAAIKALHHHVGTEVLQDLLRLQRVPSNAPLRDHVSLCPHLDDHLRICHIPKRKGANFRDLPGVVTWADSDQKQARGGTCCAGYTHAVQVGGVTLCPGGGTRKKAAHGQGHVPLLDDSAWTGTELTGCPSRTAFLPTGAPMCPNYCITFKGGRSKGNQGCFGRLWYDEIRCTVVGRAEPHNLALLHPDQDRVMSIRESARMQGFPDYYALVGLGPRSERFSSRNPTIGDRYQQMGNAVSPCVASALGRCLALAAAGAVPACLKHAVVSVPDPELTKSLRASEARGLQTYTQQQAAKQFTDPGTAVSHNSDYPESTAGLLHGTAQNPLLISDSEDGCSIEGEEGEAWQSWLDNANAEEDAGQPSSYQVEEEGGFPWTEEDLGHDDESQSSLQLLLTDEDD